MIRTSTFIVALGLISGCAIPPEVELPSEPGFPEPFGERLVKRQSGDQCPDLSGHYINDPVMYEISEGIGQFIDGEPYHFYGLFSLYLASESQEPPGEGNVDQNVLELQVGGSETLVLKFYAEGIEKVVTYEFSANESDFACTSGTLAFPVIQHYGSGEGTTINGQRQVKLRMTESGNLIAIQTYGPFRSRREVDSDEFTHQYFLYPKAE